jgi:hypothetical protein
MIIARMGVNLAVCAVSAQPRNQQKPKWCHPRHLYVLLAERRPRFDRYSCVRGLFSVGAVSDPMLLDAMLVLFLFASFLVHSGVLRCLSPSLVREH